MSAEWVWWVLGLVLVAAELITGTFYLLAVGIAFLVGGIAAWMGLPLPIQLLIAAALSLAGSWVAHHWRERRGTPPPQPPLDLGQSVHVQTWHADGTARVAYRGTHWDAVPAVPDGPRPKTMYIVGTRGSTLVIAPEPPPAHAAR